MTDARSSALAAWVQDFVERASRDDVVATFVAAVDDAVTEQVPEIANDPILVQDLHKSTGSQWRAFLALLGDDHRLVLPTQASDLALSLARRGHDLVVLLKIYRVGQQSILQFFDAFITTGDTAAPPRDEILVFMWARASSWVDDAVETLIEAFVAERQRLHDGVVARRNAQIESLLGDSPPSSADLSGSLSHALQHWQTAFVVWAGDAGASTAPLLLKAAQDVADAVRAPRPLTMVAGSRELWGWAATPGQPDFSHLPGLVDGLREDGLHLAIGVAAPGIPGFRTSHAEARAAQRIALHGPQLSPLVAYADVELLCIMGEGSELMRRMVLREAGSLAGADKNMGLVRETVLVYLKTLNVETTAEQLFVHKNTVRYRIARAEELIGHPLTQRSTQLELALRWMERFGPPTSSR
ncbi:MULTISPECIES: PucR family transcriptional regulator [unclassified Nocardioides]|uniref:PucR family transcriptional regulator n=1 Tax=unclassified Nocardioides TaxID=2615069 RepID=UPI0012E3ED34|nr:MULTISPECIES: helix-turn-helix domain-containing protein [unclassified Nocardioides]